MSTTEDVGLCYFLVCYKEVEYVAFLLASLYRPQDTFIIHRDAKSPGELRDYLARIEAAYPNIIQIDSRDYSWAGYSHVDVSLRAITRALSVQRPWSHFIFLSEQHLPLKAPATIAKDLRFVKSMVVSVATAHLGGDERSDIESRFGARYRELPGVGCFAVELSPRDPSFFSRIFHGSNWMVLHREHCTYLLDAERDGRFDLHRETVHAEENAILSVLAPRRDEVVDIDPTLIAFPHRTDNHTLTMTEELFRSALDGPHLFIRKRTHELSPFVSGTIRCAHFFEPLYRLAGHRATIPRQRNRKADAIFNSISRRCRRLHRRSIEVRRIDPLYTDYIPQIHAVLLTPAMGPGWSVRILSENLTDFRVFIVEEMPFGPFRCPEKIDGVLYSTVRAKLFGLFGYRDVLPDWLQSDGFVSINHRWAVAPVTDLAARFVTAAERLRREQPQELTAANG